MGLKLLQQQEAQARALVPQSNQRGIETDQEVVERALDQRLNRTSVGLKPDDGPGPPGGRHVPQSNQRGIETDGFPHVLWDAISGLNRTSVGLKLLGVHEYVHYEGGLNRTSVGLKLALVAIILLALGAASIEPAWD